MTTAQIPVVRYRIVGVYQSVQPGDAAGVSGQYLMGRDIVGVPMRRYIEDASLDLSTPNTCVLDFTGVKDISASVAEELGPMLLTTFSARSYPDAERYLVYANLSRDARLGLDDEFRRTGQAALAIIASDGHERARQPQPGVPPWIDLLGPPMPRPLQDIVTQCYRQGRITSGDVAEGTSLGAASKKLTDLYERYPGVFHRVKVYGESGARSWQYVYYPVVPTDTTMLARTPYQQIEPIGA